MIKTLFGAIFLLLTFISFANAALIRGTIYDANFSVVKDVVVEISTVPKQIYVTKDGNYQFEVPKGVYYRITASKQDLKASELITIKEDGEYTLDLILLPSALDLEPEKKTEEKKFPFLFLALIAFFGASILGLGVYFYKFFKLKPKVQVAQQEENAQSEEQIKQSEQQATQFEQQSEQQTQQTQEQKEELDDELKSILDFLAKEGGRTTQKEIRKAIPWSEAKVSLMLDELEVKGYIEKFKKGRGNIVILKNKKQIQQQAISEQKQIGEQTEQTEDQNQSE